MIKVWRVQNDDGRGPYRGNYNYTQWTDSGGWHDEENHPSPEADLGIHNSWDGIRFGFIDLEQAQRWFTRSELERLVCQGYHLIELEVDCVVAQSEYQLAFKPLET